MTKRYFTVDMTADVVVKRNKAFVSKRYFTVDMTLAISEKVYLISSLVDPDYCIKQA